MENSDDEQEGTKQAYEMLTLGTETQSKFNCQLSGRIHKIL
jgi:hypothetical protein